MNIEVNRKAKAYAEDSILINAAIDKVYWLLSDIQRWPQWQTAVQKVELEGEPSPGKSFDWKAAGFNIHSTFHTVNPPDEFGWTGRMWWIRAVHNWYFEPVGNGTKVTTRESLEGFGAWAMKKSLKEGMRKSLIELRKAAENRS
jgi:hypothetical protein